MNSTIHIILWNIDIIIHIINFYKSKALFISTHYTFS